MRRRKSAFSLLEIMVAIGIFAILVGLSFTNLGSARQRAKAKGMADILAEEMRSARRRAMAKGYPVAVVFPTNAGSTPCTRSFYILEGREKGEYYRGKSLGNELADAFIFVGSYNSGETTGDPLTSDISDNFNPTQWLPAGFDDNALIFTPTGRVRSSDLPVFNESFHILTALDVEYSGITATSASDPFSVTVSPLGEISVKKGADGLAASGVNSLPPIAALTAGPSSGNSDPAISSLNLLPVNNSNIYGSDVYSVSESLAQLYPEDGNTDGLSDFAPISLRVSATDLDGDQLFCRFRSTPNQGSFSVAGDANGWAPMTWDPAASEWYATTTYLAPIDASGGDSWDLEAHITDGKSVVKSAGTFDRKVRRAIGLGKIAFDKRLYNDSTGDWNDAVYAMNLDGTGITKVTDVLGVNENNPSWSPDGAYLTFSSTVNGSLTNADIYISTGDGRYIYNLTNTPNVDEQFPVFSPDGNRVVFLRDGSGNGVYGIFVQNVREGSTMTPLVYGATSRHYPASWDPTGEFLCYTEDDTDGSHLVIQRADGSSPKYRRIDCQDPGVQGSLTDGNGLEWDIHEVKWCPKDKLGRGLILLRADHDGDGKCGLYLIAVNPLDPYDATSDSLYLPDTDANPPVQLLPESEDVISCDWAPGGWKIAAACDPTVGDKYRIKVFLMSYSSWPPAPDSTETIFSGQDNFRPRFTSNGSMLIVQSTPKKDTPYSLYRIPLNSLNLDLLTSESKDVISHSNSR